MLFVLFLMSCSPGSTGPVEISVDYQDIAEPGFMDQTVLIEHGSDRAVIPTMEYTPLDADGAVVPGVEVSTVYGSDRGQLVVGTAGEIDILVFQGERSSEVVDATGTATDVVELDIAPARWVSQPRAFRDGAEVAKFEVFDAVALSNDTSSDVVLRVVCIVWNSPGQGQAQQAEQVDTVVDQVLVGAGDTSLVPVSREFAARTDAVGFGCASVKAHPTLGS